MLAHALCTGVALDIIGLAFTDISITERQAWFPPSKKQCERLRIPFQPELELNRNRYPKGENTEYGQASDNTTIVLALLQLLSSEYPLKQRRIPEVIHALSASIRTIESETQAWKSKPVGTYPVVDVGLPIPVGIAAGVYAAGVNVDQPTTFKIARALAGACGLGISQAKTVVAIASLSRGLLDTGYFEVEDVENLIASNVCSDNLASALQSFTRITDPADWLKYPIKQLPRMSYSESALCSCCWYLLRIATQLKGVVFTTVPKECLAEVFDTYLKPQDIGFLFGCLCALSEQTGEEGCYKLITPVALIDDSPYASRVRELVNTLGEE